ncbi:peptidase S51 dipeptidase E [Gordonia pseudamarae]|uniref:Peptidase S51 dipeptidase E n=1 Tax=Gordonia pseudamarae TaxID=2831662 RepID=A0ABX6IIF8_9ACTN|nr:MULTISPECIES: Type 1 glutamine amidotransferase-like domain-containing protein [Gordonia]MBD0020964.1 Type 1 glutamine amidotransferase-like domain-containing protein [Gordonia sp. (in: high G+C Gram-positive bacteria)]QHN26190.1 peptidase S51 dipeptidase E [Gordonia pseudamarae]QHN35083.1 peptidase S51 dipeptidase E [Gordonia pseudamarae]
MKALLLSWGAGAVPGFLDRHTGKAPADVRLGYLNDAMLPFAGQDFAGTEHGRLEQLGYRPRSITAGEIGSADELATILDELDALYVCGGETFVLLGNLRRHGLDEVLIDKVRPGEGTSTSLPYIGLSAGAVIAGTSIEPVSLMDDPASAPDLTDYRGLGFVDTAIVPHADSKIDLFPPTLFSEIDRTYSPRHQLTFLNDDQAILVEGTQTTIIESP